MKWFVAISLALVAVVTAADNNSLFHADQPQEHDVISGAYIVEFEDNQHDETAFFQGLRGEGLTATKRLDLSFSLFKGVSFQLDGSATKLEPSTARKKIASLTAVKKVWPVRLIPRPNLSSAPIKGSYVTESTAGNGPVRRMNTNYTNEPHAMTQVDKLQAAGLTGKGVRIAIIDTGVDYSHPALGACFGPGCVISFGTDLVGDAYNGTNVPVGDNDPYSSCEAHGTHVTGIIAARENPLGFIGAAPGADIGMYRVFGCEGYTGSDVMLVAFNQAYEDGADIITASIGGTLGWPEEVLAAGVSLIVNAGVSCTLAAGNDGSAGMFYSSSAADGHDVTAVASVENQITPMVLIGAEVVIDGVTATTGWVYGSPSLPNVTLPLWVVTPNVTTDGSWNLCNPFKDDVPDLSGKIVLVEVATCGSGADRLMEKGAEYIIFYDDRIEPPFNPYCDSSSTIKGCAMVPRQLGLEWRTKFVNGSSIILNIVDREHAPTIVLKFENPVAGGMMAPSTSWGPTWEIDAVPSFAAVGGSILSTFPVSQGSYAIDSGTSMATPLMASIYALVMEARGIKDPKVLRSLFAATALPKSFYDGTKVLDGLAPVPQQGAGLVQAYDAAFTTTLLNVASISFNDTDHFVSNASFTITNLGKEPVTYELGHTPAVTVYTYKSGDPNPATFPNPIADEHAELSFSSNSVTVPPAGTVTISIAARPPVGLVAKLLPVYSGYVTIKSGSDNDLVLPYLGVAGSMHNDLAMLDPNKATLFHNDDGNRAPAKANDTWTLPTPTSAVVPSVYPPTDFPSLLLQLTAGTALLRVDIEALGATATNVSTVDVFGTRSAGSLAGFPAEWVQRRRFTVPFSGMTQEGKILPPGNYRFVIRVLTIFGDRDKAEDYKTLALAPFNLSYQGNQKIKRH